ncbi:hypothetical protein [Aliikangiella maris]|uniref:Uncharacterized protein n=2 Tax=Aliikangiella maris TaxID=3162458 RepID=A0ABV2BYH4_9GAMM
MASSSEKKEFHYVEAVRDLTVFKDMLQAHVIKEGPSVYAFLKQEGSDSCEDVKEVQQEMNNIKRVVVGICSNYIAEGFTDDNAMNFLKKWKGMKGDKASEVMSRENSVISILIRRTAAEENGLYVTYEQVGENFNV